MEVGAEVELCFPKLLNTSCKKPVVPPLGALLLWIAVAIISLFTVVLNLLIIISVSHFRHLHTPSNLLILSMAVSDLFVGLLVIPGETQRKVSCWYFGEIFCAYCNYVSMTITSASVGHMVLISVDRYVAICDPLHYTTSFVAKKVKLLIGLCWLCSAIYPVSIFDGHIKNLKVHFSCHGQCVIFMGDGIETVDVLMSFVAPVCTIVVLYSRVFVVAVTQARAMSSQIAAIDLQVSVTLTKKSELKAARTLGVVIVVFLICLCPYYAFTLAGHNLLNGTYASYVLYLFYLNSCLNPLIYALFYPWFRKAVKLILTLQILEPSSCEHNIL